MKTQFVKNRLKELEKDPSWLAAQCGVSPVTMKQNYLRGICPPKSVLKLMAQALNCSVSELIHEEEAKAKAC